MPRTSATGDRAAPEPKAALGLPAASALVIGSIIGTGIFALPQHSPRTGRFPWLPSSS